VIRFIDPSAASRLEGYSVDVVLMFIIRGHSGTEFGSAERSGPPRSPVNVNTVPVVRPGRCASYNESGCGDAQPTIPTLADGPHLRCDWSTFDGF
jgi:hypothetical protein